MEDKKDEVTVLNTDIEQPQKEENKQNNKEQKQQDNDDKKKTLKTVIATIICTLLFIITLLLLVLLGLKNCSSNKGDYGSYSSSSSSNPPAYNYDNESLNKQFIKMVNYERLVGGFDEAPTSVVAITYIDNYPNNFNISITAKAGNTLYYYHLDNYPYSGDTSSIDNCIGYISTLDITARLDSVGSTQTIQTSAITSETIVTDKGNHYVISDADPIKYFSGFYFSENKYYVYNHVSFTSGDNPFNQSPTLEVDTNHLLFSYYQSLNS